MLACGGAYITVVFTLAYHISAREMLAREVRVSRAANLNI